MTVYKSPLKLTYSFKLFWINCTNFTSSTLFSTERPNQKTRGFHFYFHTNVHLLNLNLIVVTSRQSQCFDSVSIQFMGDKKLSVLFLLLANPGAIEQLPTFPFLLTAAATASTAAATSITAAPDASPAAVISSLVVS